MNTLEQKLLAQKVRVKCNKLRLKGYNTVTVILMDSEGNEINTFGFPLVEPIECKRYTTNSGKMSVYMFEIIKEKCIGASSFEVLPIN